MVHIPTRAVAYSALMHSFRLLKAARGPDRVRLLQQIAEIQRNLMLLDPDPYRG